MDVYSSFILGGETEYLARWNEYPDELIQIMSKVLSRLAELPTNSRLVWFQIFPRLSYIYSSDIALWKVFEYDINGTAACQVLDLGGIHNASRNIKTCNFFWQY